MEIEKKHTCCFIGHKVMIESERLLKAVRIAIEKLITENAISTFLFSGRAKFENLCFYIVGDLKKKYPHIRRIKTTIGIPGLSGDYNDYIPDFYYDDAYYPGRVLDAEGTLYRGETEKERIDMSGYCIIFHDENNDSLEELLYDSNQFTAKVAIAYAESKAICKIEIEK